MALYVVERITIEVVSAIACFILARFMVKPFELTRETRYLGLPLGFGFLGASYILSALSFDTLFDFDSIKWAQLFIRAFAFLFLAITYYFSKSAKDPKLWWNATLAVSIAVFTSLILVAVISAPNFLGLSYRQTQVYVRIFNLICIAYISIHALKSHIEQLDPKTIIIPFGYVLLGIGQYSILIWVVDSSILAFFAGLALRLAGIAIFLFVALRTFYSSGEKEE